jgi:hypothetical protein
MSATACLRAPPPGQIHLSPVQRVPQAVWAFCGTCARPCANYIAVFQCQERHHADIKLFPCYAGDCHEKFSSLPVRLAHWRQVHEGRTSPQLKCIHASCTFATSGPHELDLHYVKEHQSNVVTYVCDSCPSAGAQFASITAFMHHLRADHGSVWVTLPDGLEVRDVAPSLLDMARRRPADCTMFVAVHRDDAAPTPVGGVSSEIDRVTAIAPLTNALDAEDFNLSRGPSKRVKRSAKPTRGRGSTVRQARKKPSANRDDHLVTLSAPKTPAV